MTIRIGTAPVSWGIMEVATSWGRTQTFDSVLDEMVSAGYNGTELGPRHQPGYESAIATARLLAECGAPVVVLADAMYERRMAVAGSVVEES